MSDCFVKIHIEVGTVLSINTDDTYMLDAMPYDNTDLTL